MKYRLSKKIISALSAAAILISSLCVPLMAAAEEYFSLNFETSEDTAGWTSEYASADM